MCAHDILEWTAPSVKLAARRQGAVKSCVKSAPALGFGAWMAEWSESR